MFARREHASTHTYGAGFLEHELFDEMPAKTLTRLSAARRRQRGCLSQWHLISFICSFLHPCITFCLTRSLVSPCALSSGELHLKLRANKTKSEMDADFAGAQFTLWGRKYKQALKLMHKLTALYIKQMFAFTSLKSRAAPRIYKCRALAT